MPQGNLIPAIAKTVACSGRADMSLGLVGQMFLESKKWHKDTDSFEKVDRTDFFFKHMTVTHRKHSPNCLCGHQFVKPNVCTNMRVQ